MGYQESLVAVTPPKYAHRVVKLYESQRQNGSYDKNLCTVDLCSVIVLKQRMGAFRAGTALLWVVGDRCFHHADGLLDRGKQTGYSHVKLKFIPVEQLIQPPDTRDIDFSDTAPPSENSLFKRYTPADFLKQREAERSAR